jgi:hypothetical protein
MSLGARVHSDMAIRDDASLSEMAWELEMKLGELEGRLQNIETSQRRYTIRLRMDIAAHSLTLGFIVVALAMMWSGIGWHWWYVPAGSVIAAVLLYSLEEAARRA